MHRFLFFLAPIVLFGISYAVGQESKEQSLYALSTGDMSALTIQDQSQNKQPENSRSSIYIQFNISGLYSWLKDWKNQDLQLGTTPSTMSMIFGAECGWIINKYFQLGFGYEYFFTTKISTQQITGDQINSTFFYGSLKAEMPLESVPDLSLFIGLDIGSVTATEVFENYPSYGDLSRTGSTTGYRVMLGTQYFLIDNWSIMAEGGYLFGKISKVTVDGQIWPNYSLDLSGLIIRFAVNYHIPL